MGSLSESAPACTHRWRDCPVHSRPDGELPSFRIVLTCLYGGLPTADGGAWDQSDSDAVITEMKLEYEEP